jgi:hypothetical protein
VTFERRWLGAAIVGCLLLSGIGGRFARAQQPPPPARFGGAWSELDERRQRLVADWVSRFSKTTGRTIEVGPFYDDILSLSAKTTFDAVTQALMTSQLTDAAGVRLGDALTIVERVDGLRGEIPGAGGDRQFRMYARLTPAAHGLLGRSREFKREGDNTRYHKGYPLNYREQGGVPSIQVSMSIDGRQADIDVDYRSSSFPAALFNGHLSVANSDVRAENNAELHAARWNGFQNWWRGFFGVSLNGETSPPDKNSVLTLPKIPRAGKKNIEVMVNDFLRAWLVEGNAVAAMGYVSERAYNCLAWDAPDPAAFDRGVAPYQLLINLKAASDSIGLHQSLDAVTVGVRLTMPALKVKNQPHHAQPSSTRCPTTAGPSTAKAG